VRTRRPTHTRRAGLSLIEVMLALAILLLAMAAIVRLVDIGTERGNAARMQTRGTRLAQAKMAEVEAGTVSLASETQGNFDGDDGAWQFTVTPEPAGPLNLYTVTVRVTTTSQGRQFEVVLSQMMFDPALMGSASQAERPAPDTGETTTDPAMGMGGTSP
jgi:general secretion pathway protein I